MAWRRRSWSAEFLDLNPVSSSAAQFPADNKEPVLFDELPCHPGGGAAVSQGFPRNEHRGCSGAVEQHAFGVNAQFRVGPDSKALDSDAVQPVTGRGGADVLTVGHHCGRRQLPWHFRKAFDVGLSSEAVPPPQADHGQGDGDQACGDERREQLCVH